MTREIIVTASDGIGDIRIDRPLKKNALTTAMYAALADAFEAFDRDDAVRVVTLRGGEDFSAGNDLNDFAEISRTAQTTKLDAIVEFLTRICDFSKPLIAAVRGNAVGVGTTMLLHADVVVAGKSARFRTPFVQLGIVPEAGSSLLLPLIVGRMRAAWMLLAGQFFGAEEAFAYGLVTKLVDDDRVDEMASTIARQLAALPAVALRETKRLIREPGAQEVRIQMDAEAATLAECMHSDDFRIAVASLLR
ncbi:MAG: enoyl-CoA hydratase/isomerase family protein [Candidatus Eremiobacteraeota bacterium]|nr:enoyl-CoA hydratase/isomerase family protein [Candidatus Eremiobacteraeota bacterium]